ncbi:ATP-binding protein [Streptomyces sp. NPDC003077]|uniref:ATP-binding protein n=1 Tax=Streptomyces sp. NPDC003077 TaxID=3154443 RepID=UPI0033B7203B
MIAPFDPAEVVLKEDLLDYTPYPKSVTLARHRTARLVCEWGYRQLAGDAALLLAELATNAIRHGSVRGRLVRVHLTLTREVLRIAVSDPRGEAVPCPRAASPEDGDGRGLVLVGALAARWGVREREVGKTVWCELDVCGRQTEAKTHA